MNRVVWVVLGSFAVLVVVGGGIVVSLWSPPEADTQERDDPTVDQAALAVDDAEYVFNASSLSSQVHVISSFEDQPGTGWSGDGLYDTAHVYEGRQSLQLISLDGSLASSELLTDGDFASYEYFELALFVDNPLAYDTLALDFGRGQWDSFYRYTFTQLSRGWNIVRLRRDQFASHAAAETEPRLSWDEVEAVRFTLQSRPHAVVTARFDLLTGLTHVDDLLTHFRLARGLEQRVTLVSDADVARVALHSTSSGIAAAVSDVADATDFMLATTLWPQSEAASGLFFRGDYATGAGYYFTVAGDVGNEWYLQRRDADGFSPLVWGEFETGYVTVGEPYELLVVAHGPTIQLFMKQAESDQLRLLEQVEDREYQSGGVGAAVVGTGWSTFDDIRYQPL